MLKKFLRKWGLSGSEKEIKTFLELFSQGDIEQNGIVIGSAALIHYSLGLNKPEFKRLLNSNLGENQGHISTYILQFNRLLGECHRAGQLEAAAGIKFWNTTFRCMSDESLHPYGVQLWKIASKSFGSTKDYLRNELAQATESNNQGMKEKIEGALNLCNFVPPQFLDR